MSIKKITYNDKSNHQFNPELPREKKATAEDFNEIKEVVNNNADELSKIDVNTINQGFQKLKEKDVELKAEIDKKQEILKAGKDIEITSDNTINFTGTTGSDYMGGNGINISDSTISIDTLITATNESVNSKNTETLNEAKKYTDESIAKIPSGKSFTFTAPLQEIDGDVSLQQEFINKVNKVDILEDNINNDILPNLQDNTSEIQKLEKNIASNTQKIEQIKGLDNLVNGDNVILQDQGSNEKFINTNDNLKISSLTARNGVINVESEAHFKNTTHIEQGIIIDNTNLGIASEIEMLDNDLKIINNNGDILLADKTGVINTRTLKNNQDKLISELSNAVVFKNRGVWNSQTTYNKYDMVEHNGDKYWLDKDSSINEEPSPQNKFWIDFTPNFTPNDTYTKQEIDNKFETTNQNVSTNTSSINDLNLKHQLVNQRLDKIDREQEFTTTNGNQWEESLVFAEISPTSPDKTKFNLKPSSIKEYQLKQSLITYKQDLDLVKGELKDILTSTNKDTINQLFYGQEDKDQDPRTYGYITSYGKIPLAKQIGQRTFGNIFNVDYNEWNGVFYNNIKIPFGTNNTSLGIDLRDNSFQANTNIQNITLYKEVVNDGITESEVNEKLKGYAKKDSDNIFTNINEFDNDTYFLKDKALKFGWSRTDIKFQIESVSGNKDSRIHNPQGLIEYKDCKTPTEGNDVANKEYVDNKFKTKLTDKVLILPRNSKLGVDSWNDYESKFVDVVDIDNKPINLNSTDYVSNNEGAYNGYSRSYINYVDFYLPKETNKLNEILQQARDYGDSVKPQIMDLNGGDFTWSDSYALYYKEVKPSEIPFDKVIGYSIWSTNNIGKSDFNGLALTAFIRQISSGGFNVYIMNNSKQIPAINEFRVRISYFKWK